jgi:hypothetical protein
MITKASILESYIEIQSLFGDKINLCDIHTLETSSEGSCTLYYADLKKGRYNANLVLQFAKLWKIIYIQESNETLNTFNSDLLRERFQFLIDDWITINLEKKDILRANSKIQECQISIDKNKNSRNSWLTNRQAGYYLNNKFKANVFPQKLINKISNSKKGLVVTNEWNDFMLFLINENKYSLFYWTTYA